MNYVINKGRHHHRLWPFYPIGIYINKRVLEFDVIFDSSCKYFFDDVDRFDVNKLYGLSFGINPHKESVRFGWNYDQASGKINLHYYCYINGERQMEYLCSVPLYIKTRCRLTLVDNGYLFDVKSQHTFIESENKKGLSFLLHPYFGGNRKAPHKIKIKIL